MSEKAMQLFFLKYRLRLVENKFVHASSLEMAERVGRRHCQLINATYMLVEPAVVADETCLDIPVAPADFEDAPLERPSLEEQRARIAERHARLTGGAA